MPSRPIASAAAILNASKLLAGIVLASFGNQIARLKAKKPHRGFRPTPASRQRSAGTHRLALWWWSVLRRAAAGWMTHNASTLGAAIAYYSLFSIGPLILIAISVAGLVYDQESVRGQMLVQLSTLLGEQGSKAIASMLADAGKPAEGVFATLIGAGTLIFAAIGVVVQLKGALNTVWDVKSPSGAGIWHFFRTYAVSLAGVLSLGFLLLISLLLTIALSAVGKMLVGAPEAALQATSLVATLAMTTGLFAMMFKWLPDIAIGWREVLPGSILTAGLFEIGKFLIGFYIGKQGFESTYGAAASLVIVLIWVYYSAQLVLFGAEFTRAYSEVSGHRNNRPRERTRAT
jgi:membrane protein